MTDYTVTLDVYSGPLDLLLFLIRRDEIDIYDIPIARLTSQYLDYVELLEVIDPDHLSEFLVLAATLIEIKSRTLLPRPVAEEGETEMVDPRLELVQQLLEYKKYKDAARNLDASAAEWASRHARAPVLPHSPADEMELESLDLFDLVDAFKRMLEQVGRAGAVHRIGVDDTPLALHAEDIVDSIQRSAGLQPFEQLFAGRNKAEMIGLFLALLELIRQKRVRVSQDVPFGPILVHLLDATPLDESADGDDGWAYKARDLEEDLCEAEPVVSDDALGDVTEDDLPERMRPAGHQERLGSDIEEVRAERDVRIEAAATKRTEEVEAAAGPEPTTEILFDGSSTDAHAELLESVDVSPDGEDSCDARESFAEEAPKSRVETE